MGGGGGPFVPRSKDEMAHIPWFVDWSLSFTASVYAAQASNPSLALKIDLPFTRASPALDSVHGGRAEGALLRVAPSEACRRGRRKKPDGTQPGGTQPEGHHCPKTLTLTS